MPSEQSHSFRIHAAMTLFELEQALASYVTDLATTVDSLPRQFREPLLERALHHKSVAADSQLTVADIVRETYIGELIDLAIAASAQRSDHSHLRRLKELADDLGIYEIRNAVCHPSRPFPDCYWYRIAAIATDPCIAALNLTRVRKAFEAAVAGALVVPPEDWLSHCGAVIPNNLPSTFDHAITGLIGREREITKLQKHLSNRRFTLLALVGRGGTGKTALCNQVLSDSCHDPATLHWCDEIIYVSAKTELLTAAGIEPVNNAATTLDALRREIVSILSAQHDIESTAPFDAVADQLASHRVLLYLDNLETLLRDAPDEFDDFFACLPDAWRVLVTSRVPVNSATIIPLGELSQGGAQQLARDYLERRGGDRLVEAELTRIVNACDRNPLAIRLVVDAYLAGAEIGTALDTTKTQVLEFSYSRLIDALPPPAIQILECLFGLDGPVDRLQLAYLLDISLDEVATGLSHLCRTSLLTRDIESAAERYSLSSSVRDLLLRIPKNLGVRESVSTRLRSQRQVLADVRQSTEFNPSDPCAWNHIPAGAPPAIVDMVVRAFRSMRKTKSQDERIAMLETLRRAVERENPHPIVFRAMGILLLNLHDRYGAIAAYRRACDGEHKDPASALALATLLRTEKQLEESRSWSGWLLEKGYGQISNSSVASACSIHKEHWIATTWLNEFNITRDATSKWRDQGELSGTFGTLFVDAVRRSLEQCTNLQVIESESVLILQTLSELFDREGYAGEIVHEGFKALDEIRHACRRVPVGAGLAVNVCEFLNKHLAPMCDVHYERTLKDEPTRLLIECFFEGLGSEHHESLRRDFWLEVGGSYQDPVLSQYGYLLATVYNRPRASGMYSPFMFARGTDDRQYYIHRNATGMTRDEFDGVREGDTLLVLPADEGDPDRAWPVKDAMRP